MVPLLPHRAAGDLLLLLYPRPPGQGPAFIKVCAYAPYPVKVWCNGHEIARRAALAEGIAVTPLANGFAATSGCRAGCRNCATWCRRARCGCSSSTG